MLDALPAFGVALVRPLAALAPLPLAGTKPLPVALQASLAMALAVFVLPQVRLAPAQLDPLMVVGIMAGEAVTGLGIGLLLSLPIAAARIAGETIGGAMGIGFAALIDPEHGQPVPTVGQFLSLLTVALFMSLDGPVVLIGILSDSYRAMPPGGGLVLDRIPGVLALGSTMFATALSLALPVLGATMLAQIALAVMGRLAPQLNLFAVGLPATLALGLLVLALAIPAMGSAMIAAWHANFAATAAFAR